MAYDLHNMASSELEERGIEVLGWVGEHDHRTNSTIQAKTNSCGAWP